LGDHLDHKFDQEPVVGLVGTDQVDRGLIGWDWYLEGDRDPISLLGGDAAVKAQADAAIRLLEREGFGDDEVTDLAGIVLSGELSELDAGLSRVVEKARAVSDDSVVVVVTATGRSAAPESASVIEAGDLRDRLERAISARKPVIEAVVPGGLYLDQREVARLELSDDVVLSELLRMKGEGQGALMADAFPGVAVTFGRYC
jgi:hypothetical protein